MEYIVKSKYIDKENKKKGRWFKRIVIFSLVLVLMIASYGSGLYTAGKNEILKELARNEVVFLGNVLGTYSQAKAGVLTQDVSFGLFWEVWDTLKSDYVDRGKINEKELFYGALEGMTAALGDPYTVFMDPKLSQEFEDDLSGTFEGIGAEIGIRDEILTVIAPLDDMPAKKAGLRAGDKIYAINDEPTAGISVDEAVKKIRGPRGTSVKLTISQDGMDGIEDITITRSVIVVKSLKTEYRSDKIYVIKVSNFNEDTSDLFNKAVGDILVKNPSSLILDLRNNPGGYLDTAIELASEWIEDGVIVTEKYSDESREEHLARGRARLKDYKTVVLVNQGSASASEIVAGALRDYGKATIVGMKTYGKGSVQSLKEFTDGSSVKVTVAKWLTPNDDSINDVGIAPDIEVDLTIEDYQASKDPQMDKAVEILQNK